jgi:mannose/fructose/N-acetylgalactosamine-specific phosphotransferase system component IIC
MEATWSPIFLWYISRTSNDQGERMKNKLSIAVKLFGILLLFGSGILAVVALTFEMLNRGYGWGGALVAVVGFALVLALLIAFSNK